MHADAIRANHSPDQTAGIMQRANGTTGTICFVVYRLTKSRQVHAICLHYSLPTLHSSPHDLTPSEINGSVKEPR